MQLGLRPEAGPEAGLGRTQGAGQGLQGSGHSGAPRKQVTHYTDKGALLDSIPFPPGGLFSNWDGV